MLLTKIAIVSTNTPGKPFSPKSMMRSMPREHKTALDLENSGVFNKNFGNIESMLAFDTEAGGIVTACGIYDVPFLMLKVINYHIGDEMEFISSPRVSVEAQPHIGNIIEVLLEELVHSFGQ